MSGEPWTDEDRETVRAMYSAGESVADIAHAVNRSHRGVDAQIARIRSERGKAHRQSIERHALAPSGTAPDYQARCLELEEENARLKQQLTWSQHSLSENRTGGVLTIRESDVHHCDENHLRSCYASVHAKILEVIRQYEPDTVQIVGFDDWLCGSGIYKEQDLHSAVADPEKQMAVGAMKARDWLCSIREVTDAPIKIKWLRGNHEYARGVSIGPALFYQTCMLCRDIADVDWKLHVDAAIVNLAAAGTYNALVMHGFGNSRISPNSSSFVDAIKDKIIGVQRKLAPEQHIRRVASGHTHWRSCGLERIPGLPFDTTGGYQRNERVKLGMNQRPIGSIVYVSPRDLDSDILKPLELCPDQDTLDREMVDSTLPAQNREDAGAVLTRYEKFCKAQGIKGDCEEFGVLSEGRW